MTQLQPTSFNISGLEQSSKITESIRGLGAPDFTGESTLLREIAVLACDLNVRWFARDHIFDEERRWRADDVGIGILGFIQRFVDFVDDRLRIVHLPVASHEETSTIVVSHRLKIRLFVVIYNRTRV